MHHETPELPASLPQRYLCLHPHTLPVMSESRGVSLYGDQILFTYVLASRAFSSSQGSPGASLYQLSPLPAFLVLSTCKLPHHEKMKQGLPWWSSGKEFTLQCRGHWVDLVGELGPHMLRSR
ncbi:unnamed protein product [Rangifer tarandus platyrhynchus]|uniref:Uncharacterized protein n=1 Tax=Rangifer tarandus platyrhynchus TaxID=3082113 RepID=A0ABN8ZU48_RANTA|nr:unnamed protein product [Rangifer tarandus platyrhynchus]